MTDSHIENPVINAPFTAPARHFKFDDEGITPEIIEARRPSSYFMPVAAPKKWGKKHKNQAVLDTEWTDDGIEENRHVNQIRENIVVINDEAHHCYRRRVDREAAAVTKESFNAIVIQPESLGGHISMH